MTKVTNIYIDTVGFTNEQYSYADNAMEYLKGGQMRSYPEYSARPEEKSYPILGLDRDGDRFYGETIEGVKRCKFSASCQPVSLSDLMEIEMRARHERSLKLGKFRIIVGGKPVSDNGQSIAATDRMTPKKERAIVNGLMDALLSNRLISKMAHSVVTGAMQGYYSANDTQS